MAEQLTFDWPTGVALGAEDFFVAPPNAVAYAMATAPVSWPEGKLLLVGPTGCGKSHLARVFAQQADAQVITLDDLTEADPKQPTVVEDLDTIGTAHQEPLFHLHNNLRANAQPLLMTAKTPPAQWRLTLPDLASRLQATSIAEIAQPDEALLQALMMKLFADRQLMPNPNVFQYLLPRIDRTFAAAARMVAALDAEALATKAPITRTLARRVLDKLPQNG